MLSQSANFPRESVSLLYVRLSKKKLLQKEKEKEKEEKAVLKPSTKSKNPKEVVPLKKNEQYVDFLLQKGSIMDLWDMMNENDDQKLTPSEKSDIFVLSARRRCMNEPYRRYLSK